MISYSVPEMAMENEFYDLVMLGKLVDTLLKSGNEDYGFVYEWRDGPDSGHPPVAVLFRKQGKWVRHVTMVTSWRKDDHYRFIYEFTPDNAH